MMEYTFDRLDCRLVRRVLTVTISNPPVNVMTRELFADLAALTSTVAEDDAVQVVIFESAAPDFFIAHYDISALVAVPTADAPTRSDTLGAFHSMCETVRTMGKATIARIAGRVGGGGSEFAASCDMRFGVYGETIINQMEVPIGILPGGSGTQRLPRLLGRGRAMEVILGGDDLDARTAEAWGYLNRAFDSRSEMYAHVDRLAARIARFPAEAVALAKEAVNSAEKPLAEGLADEAYLFQKSLRTEGAQRNMRRILDLGAQTRDGEKQISDLSVRAAGDIED